MSKEGSAKSVNIITIGTVGLTLGFGNISHYFEYAFIFYSMNIHHIDKGNITVLSYAIIDFHLFYDGAADIQK